MEILDIFIYLFGFLMVISAAGVVFSSKSLNSALCLVATMALIAVEFALMRADFIATLQILVYAGAIMILVVFVIMLLGVEREIERVSLGLPTYVAGFFAIIFLIVLFSILKTGASEVLSIGSQSGHSPSDAKTIGKMLLVDYVLAFQGVGVLLLAAIIAAAKLAYSPRRPLLPGRGLQAMKDKFKD